MAGDRVANARITADSRRLDSSLRTARNKFDRFGKQVKKQLKSDFRSMRQSIGTLAGFGGLGTMAVMAQQVFDFEKSLTRLGIAAQATPQEIAKVREEARGLAEEFGVGSDDILGGVAKFVELTGDFGKATAAMRTLTMVSAATGAEMSDVSSTAAAMIDNLKIDPAELEQAFSVLIHQGKNGAVELKDLAGLMAGLSPQWRRFADSTGAEGLAEMGAIMQGLRKGFGSAEEAATGFNALMASIPKKAKEFEKVGVKVFTKNPKTGAKELRPFSDIIDDIANSKLAKNPELLAKAFGRDEAVRAFEMYRANRDMIRDLTENIDGLSDVLTDANTWKNSAAGKLAATFEKLKNTFAEVLTPQRIENLAAAFSKFADAMGFLADHSEAAIGLFVAGKFGPTFFSSMAKGTDSLAVSLRGVGGALNTVGALGSAAFVGWGIGKVIDDLFGLSDKLSEVESIMPWWVRAHADKGAAGPNTARKKMREDVIAEGRALAGPGATTREAVNAFAEKRVGEVGRKRAAKEIDSMVLKDEKGVPIAPQTLPALARDFAWLSKALRDAADAAREHTDAERRNP